MCHDQNPFDARRSNCDEALLRTRMVRVRIRQRQGVTIDSGGFLERNPVLSTICSSFCRVPFKIHTASLLHFVASVGKYKIQR